MKNLSPAALGIAVAIAPAANAHAGSSPALTTIPATTGPESGGG